MSINEQLLAVLACPACKAKVDLRGEQIVCTGCGRRYPIRDDIPVMLLSEAIEPDDGREPSEPSAGTQ